ncbi:MAG: YceI family protein [Chitinophagaceae bacterium]
MEKNVIQTIWAIDPIHSQIRFEARYLLSHVSGWFPDFEGTVISSGEGFDQSELRVAIYTNSVYTGNNERDRHLRSADFFDAINYPVIGFHSTGVNQAEGDLLKITGLLDIKGIQVKQEMETRYLGVQPDQLGNIKAGFSLDALFNRKDFGISWNQLLDKGGTLLSDEIRVHADVQLLRLTSPPASPGFVQQNQ